jgi:hypothetical protein
MNGQWGEMRNELMLLLFHDTDTQQSTTQITTLCRLTDDSKHTTNKALLLMREAPL